MKIITATALCTLIIVLSAPAQAEEAKPKKNWSDEAELSFVNTSGNSETSTFAAKNLLKIKFTDKLEGEWDIAALKSQSTDKTTDRNELTAERYSTNLRLSYLFTERFYSGLGTGWSRDEFAGLQNRYYAGAFVGYKFLTGPKHLLKGELGLNYADEDYTKKKELKNFKDKDFVEGRAFGLYEYALTEKTKFSQSVEYFFDQTELRGPLCESGSRRYQYNRPNCDGGTGSQLLRKNRAKLISHSAMLCLAHTHSS